MTEQEWLGCSDPSAMLHYLHDQMATLRTRWQGPFRVRQWRTSERKLRLFACGCCRYVALWLCSDAARAVIALAEQFAEEQVDFAALERALAMADGAEQARARQSSWADYSRRAFEAVACLARRKVEEVVTAAHLSGRVFQSWSGVNEEAVRANSAAQANLLREIVGNPFAPARLDPAWLSSNDRAVDRIAQAIHDERAYGDLPILADALVDAGCHDEAILAHCRQVKSAHCPGCWVIDLLTGRE
jgi:hypothetical protein